MTCLCYVLILDIFQLIPLYFCVGLGCAGAAFYTLRLAFRNPDVAWIRKEGQISNEEYAAKQYKVRIQLLLS